VHIKSHALKLKSSVWTSISAVCFKRCPFVTY